MRAWRIASDTPDYTADDLSGTGARLTGGRWNRVGNPLLYCAASPSLACLETIVHLGAGGLPLNRYLVAIDIPETLWSERRELAPGSLPVGWDATPPGKVSLDVGDSWLAARDSLLLVVPSAIVPEDFVVLINPVHSDIARIKATKLRKWLYDSRIQGVGI